MRSLDDLPREFALAVSCAIWPPSERRIEAVRRTAAATSDWERFVRVVARQRIQGLAYDGIATAGVEPPRRVFEALRAGAQTVARESLSLVAEAARLRDAFGGAHVSVAFIKGPTLAAMIYGTVGVRHAKDLDLLVAPENALEAAALLEHAGYVRTAPPAVADGAIERWTETHKDFEFFHPARKIQVELHWRLTDNPRLMTRAPLPAAWIEQPVAGTITLPTFTREDLFAYLCAHGANHAWFRLKWLADIGGLLEGADPAAVERMLLRAEEQGLERPAAQAMLLASVLLGTRLPQRPPDDRVSAWLAAMAIRAMTRGDAETEPLDLRFGSTWMKSSQYLLRPDWRFRSAQFRIDMMNGDDGLLPMLPRRLAFLGPLLRVPRWAWKRAVHAGRSPR